jgi:hypothetical protein
MDRHDNWGIDVIDHDGSQQENSTTAEIRPGLVRLPPDWLRHDLRWVLQHGLE